MKLFWLSVNETVKFCGLKVVIMPNEFKQKAKSGAIVSGKVNDYGSEPFFIKKAKESKKFLEKHGFLKELLRKNKPERG